MTDPEVNMQKNQTMENLMEVGQLKFDKWLKRLFPKDVLKRTELKKQLQQFLQR